MNQTATHPATQYPRLTSVGRTLVTGANGFIGAQLCRTLKAHGVDVVGGVRKGANLDALRGIEIPLAYGDIIKPDTHPALLKDIDTVIHNAGLVKSRTRKQMYRVNADGAAWIADAAIQTSRVKRFIFISSQAAGGPSKGAARTEAETPNPITTYGKSKLDAERRLLQLSTKLNIQIARPTGVYGPGDKEVLVFFKTVNRGLRPLIGDTKRLINMIYIDDLTSALTELLMHDLPTGSIYNIGHSDALSYAELISGIKGAVGGGKIPIPVPGAVLKVAGALSERIAPIFGIAPMLTSEKAREILSSWNISIEKARKEFGYTPKVSFSEGAQSTADWYRKQGWL